MQNSTIVRNEECKQLALIWLQQQDLSEKSPTEISNMYFKAFEEIQKNYDQKYPSSKFPENTRHVISPGIKIDE